jgi:hypothetical protein
VSWCLFPQKKSCFESNEKFFVLQKNICQRVSHICRVEVNLVDSSAYPKSHSYKMPALYHHSDRLGAHIINGICK